MIETFEVESLNGVAEYVKIINGEVSTVMLKTTYEELQAQQAEQSTPIVAAE
jgi:hypothetical protein